MIWKFYLKYDGQIIEIDEPVNFDSVVFSLKRDLKTHGMVFEFSTTCSFYKEARVFILKALNEQNINAEVKIYITYLDFQTQTYKKFYEGLLGLRDIEITDTFATLRIENDNFLRRFNSKKDLNVAIIPNLNNVELHSKVIRQRSDWRYDNGFNVITRLVNTTLGGKLNAYLFALSASANELETSASISNFYANNISNINPSANGSAEVPSHYIEFRYSGVVKIKYNIKGKCSLTNTVATSAEGNLILQLFATPSYSFNAINNIWVSGPQLALNTGIPRVFDFDLDGDISINVTAGDKLYFNFVTNTNNTNLLIPANIVTSFEYNSTSFFEVSQDTVSENTLHKGVTIFDALSQIVKNYTGDSANFESDFFNYGCGANRMLANGLWLRKLDKDFFANFKDLFDSLKNIDNLGLSVYKQDGKDVIRVEKMAYFYKEDLIKNIQYPNDFKITLSPDLYANKINVGYEKWNNEAVGKINGLDEFNANMQFSTKVESSNYFDKEGARNEFNFLSKIIASGYLIESARRQIGKETTDNQTDNDVFVICLNDTKDRAEKNENFAIVENIISPETAYNLRISPKRNLFNFAPVLVAGLIKNNGLLKDAIFRSGVGNFKMKTQTNNECLEINEVIENQNFELLKKIAIFEAEVYTFSYPITFVEYQSILDAPFGIIQVSFSKTIFTGFILELVYKPNSGLANFKLIKSVLPYGVVGVEFQDGQPYDFQDGDSKDFQDQ